MSALLAVVAFGAVASVTACDEAGVTSSDAALADLASGDDLAVPAMGRSCSQAIDLTPLIAPWAGSTVGGSSLTGAQCDGVANQAPEEYFTYDAGAAAIDVVVDVVVDAQHPWDALVSARSDCADASSEEFCADNGGSQHLELLGVSGVFSIIVDGTDLYGGSDQGAFTIAAHTRAIVGAGDACDANGVTNRCGGDTRCQSGSCVATSADLECAAAIDLTAPLAATGTATANGRFLIFEPGYFAGSCSADQDPSWPERLYQVTVSAPSLLTATTDDPNRTDFDTVVYLRQGACGGNETACDDDTDTNSGQLRSRFTTEVQPGLYYLFVDASTSITYGQFNLEPRDYSLTVSLTPLAVDAGHD